MELTHRILLSATSAPALFVGGLLISTSVQSEEGGITFYSDKEGSYMQAKTYRNVKECPAGSVSVSDVGVLAGEFDFYPADSRDHPASDYTFVAPVGEH